MFPGDVVLSRKILSPLSLVLGLSACATGPATQAPEPQRPIDPAVFYTGTWYEIGRTPIFLTDGCVAGTTKFYTNASGNLVERDACHKGSPAGPEKIFKGIVQIDNPGENTKITVHYKLYGFIPVTQKYWMLDHGQDYGWFIVSDPSETHVDILARDPRPSDAQVAFWKSRVVALGYDPSKMEFPERFPPGQFEP
jgi:apolipoprotein D and lipocalin family protein